MRSVPSASVTRATAASQMNASDAAHATVRTSSAANFQVSSPSCAGRFIALPTSSGVTIRTGSSDSMASARRARWVSVSTSAGFCSVPVALTR